MSSIESASAAIPATRDITVQWALAPAPLSAPTIARCSATGSGSPACSARAISGTSPASATRFGSSNVLSIVFGAYSDCIGRVHLDPWERPGG